MLPLRIFISTLLMAVTPVLIRMADASSFAIGVVRLSIGVALTLVFIKGARDLSPIREFSGSRGRTIGILIAIGVCFGIHWVTYFESIQRSSASLGILALCTYGIHVSWMGALFSDRRPSRHDWVGVLLSALGAWVCLPSPETNHGAFIGFLFGMTSAAVYAALPLLHQRIVHVPHGPRALSQFTIAWLLFVPAVPLQDWELSTQTWILLGVMGVFSTFVAHNLWIAVTTEVRPATSGLLFYLTIPMTMLLEATLLDAPPSETQWLGAGLVLAGNGYVFWVRTRAARAEASPDTA